MIAHMISCVLQTNRFIVSTALTFLSARNFLIRFVVRCYSHNNHISHSYSIKNAWKKYWKRQIEPKLAVLIGQDWMWKIKTHFIVYVLLEVFLLDALVCRVWGPISDSPESDVHKVWAMHCARICVDGDWTLWCEQFIRIQRSKCAICMYFSRIARALSC